MPNSINTTLPKKYLDLLERWVLLISASKDIPDFAKYIHEQIANNDDAMLSDYEKIVLKSLLTCKSITRENLYDYYLNYPNIAADEATFLEQTFGISFKVPNHRKIIEPSNNLIKQDEEHAKVREEWFKCNAEIEKALADFNFSKADEIYAKNSNLLVKGDYKRLKRRKAKDYLASIVKVLESHDFLKADELFNKFPELINREDYEKLKTVEVIKYFSTNFNEKGKPFVLDVEQAEAIAAMGKSILVSARAGSGKTRVLSAKILYLLEKEKLNEDEICVLAFNRAVPEEIVKRVTSDVSLNSESEKYSKVEVAKTFHSLAMSLLKVDGKILVKERFTMIKKIVEHLKESDEAFKDMVYKFLKDAPLEVDGRQFNSEEDYRNYLRGLKYQTIKGEEVKSYGEKIIADYLYEHGVDYVYEKFVDLKKISSSNWNYQKEIKALDKKLEPDFYLPEYNLMWEHWAIDENNNKAEDKENFRKKFNSDWDFYHQGMQKKRVFWSKDCINSLSIEDEKYKFVNNIKGLLETNAYFLLKGREHLENIIEEVLTKQGVKLIMRDEAELFNLAWQKAGDRFSKLMEQFINRFQQMYFDDKYSFEINIARDYEDNERLSLFAKLGLTILREYESQLAANKKTDYLEEFNGFSLDFNQLIAKSVNEIQSGNADEAVRKFKWILIDEYQDFSKLFFSLIQAIRNRNPSVHLFCVGDSWQAINRFAGAETKYFDEFEAYFPDCNIKNITTNYRSYNQIIERSNNFMAKCGYKELPAKAFNYKEHKQVEIHAINKTFVNQNSEENEIYYKQFIEPKGPIFYKKISYLCLLVELINGHREKKILILTRNNKLFGLENYWIIDKLKRVLINKYIYRNFEEVEKHISISTMHSSKGMQSDVVIILDVIHGVIPMYHQDADLFQIFGETYSTIIGDQQKLFYVAVTRAKEKLYIVTKEGDESSFLKDY